MPLSIQPATPADLTELHRVIERAYRGDHARQGWTHEADLLDGARTDVQTLSAILESADDLLLVARAEGAIAGCVQITTIGDGLAYLGLLCVDPERQAAGLGRQIVAEAERQAFERFGAAIIEMTVISTRAELLAYYERRGYRATGELRPFPIAVDPPLSLAVLEKQLA